MLNSQEAELFSVKAKEGLCSHAYIIDGAEGIGKLSFALHCASALLCTGDNKPCGYCAHCRKIANGDHPDVFIIGREKTASIADVREIIRRATLKPNDSDRQVFIVCNAGKLREDAQNALLKLFEEPPASVAVFLLTESRSSLLPTVLSRGQRIHLDGLSYEDMNQQLKKKYPKATFGEIHSAIEFACGNLGAAQKFLSKESSATRAKAEKLITFAVTKNSYELLELLLVPKYKRDQLLEIFGESIFLICEFQKQKFGAKHNAPISSNCAQAVKGASKRALSAMCEMIQLAMMALENNANITATVTKLSIDLLAAAAR